MNTMTAALTGLMLFAALPALAQTAVPNTPSGQAFAAIDVQAEDVFAVPLTGDADIDFMRALVPQHQRAIEMAQVVLEHGYDPEVRSLAQTILAEREAELDVLLTWLAARE